MPDRAIIWSYGGGTQSAAIAVMLQQGILPKPERIVMSNTTREATETWNYTFEYILPLLASIGLGLDIITADGRLYWNDKKTLPLIPAYNSTGGKIPQYCSSNWKRDVIWRYLRQQGYGPKRPIVQWLGISMDESHRMKQTRRKWVINDWPLITIQKTYRKECQQLALDAGLPMPPRSSCWMCPHRDNDGWRKLYNYYPIDWREAIELDYVIRERDESNNLFIHRDAVPLDQVDIERNQSLSFDGCDSGYCEGI